MEITNNYFEKLKDNFSITDGSIESFRSVLDNLIMSSYLDRHDVRKHNELMFTSNPLYVHKSFEDIRLLEITLDVLKSDVFRTFDEFNSFISYVDSNDSFKEMNSCFRSLDQSKRIIAVEGKYSTNFSERYKSKTDIMFNNIYLNDDNMAQLYKKFPYKYDLYSGKKICELIDFLEKKKNENYLLFKDDIIESYPNFDISTIDNYKENDDLEDFCIMMDEFNKTFSNEKRGVKHEI